MLPVLAEVLFGVINDVVCPKGAHQFDFFRAAHRSYFRTERFGNLHREAPHAARCTMNQNLLPSLNFALITQAL